MYLITNAMKNLLRNKGRNILIAAVTLAIIVSTVVTLTINNAAAKVIDNIRLELGSRVEIGQDLIEMKQAGFDGRADANYISIDNFYSYAQSDYLREVIYSAEMYAWSGTFFAVDDEAKGTGTRTNNDGTEFLMDTLKMVSTSKPDQLPDFGTLREIVAGRMFENLNECIISEDIARLNDVSVGDTIEIDGVYADKTFTLTIVGIYSDATDEYINAWMNMFGSFPSNNRRNEIITSWETLLTAGWETNHGLNMTTEYFLKNPDDIQKFEAEVRAKGLPVTYNVAINQDALDKVSGPLSGMRSAVLTFMIVILILGAIVLALISFMAVRERKYEVGVLRAMGMERGKVAFGMLTEAVMIAALCLAVGLGAGSAMAQPLADSMLEGRVAAAETESGMDGNRVLMTGGQMSTSDKAAGYVPESEIEVSLNSDVIVQIILITLGLAALSGFIGVAIITQYEPLKILRERA
jgi:putative ABC transport system permease protein